MRVTTLLRKLIGVTSLLVEGVVFATHTFLEVKVKPRWKHPRCGACRKRAPGYDRLPKRRWQHLAFGRIRINLSYAPRRVDCPECGVRTEYVPWARHASRYTSDFEEMVAYLAQITDKTKVTKLTGIAWRTVGSIVARVVEQNLDSERLKGLKCIGIDEFSYRKHHRYVTVVVDHARRRVIWAAKGKTSEVLGQFFELLGEKGRKSIESVTIDMARSYQKAVREWLPHAEIVFDRFHVAKLASDALDAVRRNLVRAIEDDDEARAVKKSRFTLLKNPLFLHDYEWAKLADIQRTNFPLYRAYLLKECLAEILDLRQPEEAREALKEWLVWTARSRLKPFVKLSQTIREHFEGIIAYIQSRLTNGIVEGFNNKHRMVARRAFGFHSAEALIGMMFLVSGGIKINPPLPA